MAKNNHTLGKILALTTTVAAIGGACYIFRDKIRQSAIYKKSADKLSGLFGKSSDDFMDDDDFFFDDEDDIFTEEDIFSEDSKNNREYTSISVNSKQEEEVPYPSPLPDTKSENDIPVTEDNIASSQETNFSPITEGIDTTTAEETASPIAEENSTTVEENDSFEEENDLFDTEESTNAEESLEEVTEIFADETIPTISFGGFGTPASTPEPPTTSDSDSSNDENDETVTGYENEGLSDVSEDPDVLEEQDKLDF